MKNTGALLKSKRESSNLSLSEVALATKINPKILAAIEKGDDSHLPAKTFLKGFVRSYALFLKMDVDMVMRSFQEETGGPPPAPPISDSARPAKHTKSETSTAASRRRVGDESSSGLRTVAVVVIVVLIGLIIGVRELIEKYQRERVVEASADLNKATPVVSTADLAATVPPSETTVPPTAAVVAPTGDVAPDTGDVVALDSATVPPASKTVDTKLVAVDLKAEVKSAEVKPTEVKAPEVKLTEEKVDTKTDTKSEAPKIIAHAQQIMSSRVDLIRMPINNLVELRPTELSPPRPLEPMTSQPPPKAEETKVVEVKPTAPAVAPAIPVSATPAPAKPVEAKPVETKPEEAKPTQSPIQKAAKNEIILEALDKVEVKFQVKGETKRVSLGPTQVHTIHAELPMTLDLSDGGAVNIILNGRERGVPGDLGKPKTIKIP